MRAQIMLSMLLTLFISIALASFIVSLAAKVNSTHSEQESALNHTEADIMSSLTALRNQVP